MLDSQQCVAAKAGWSDTLATEAENELGCNPSHGRLRCGCSESATSTAETGAVSNKAEAYVKWCTGTGSQQLKEQRALSQKQPVTFEKHVTRSSESWTSRLTRGSNRITPPVSERWRSMVSRSEERELRSSACDHLFEMCEKTRKNSLEQFDGVRRNQ